MTRDTTQYKEKLNNEQKDWERSIHINTENAYFIFRSY